MLDIIGYIIIWTIIIFITINITKGKSNENYGRVNQSEKIEYMRSELNHSRQINQSEFKGQRSKKFPFTGRLKVITEMADPIDKGRAFENYMGGYFRRNGFDKVSITKLCGDGGRDLECHRGDDLYFVELKCWKYFPNVKKTHVDIDVLMNLEFACESNSSRYVKYNPVVITTSIFTEDAISYAKQRNIVLVDGFQLSERMENKTLIF